MQGSRPITRLLLLASMLLAMSPAWSLELDVILAKAAVTPPSRVGFREERHNPMFKEPLVLTGHLEYLSDGVLRKTIATPFAESFLIDSDRIVIERAGDVRTLPLKKSRSLQMILSTIEAILSGQADKIESEFTHQIGGTPRAWSVMLAPVSRTMRRQLVSLQVTGDDQSVTSIRIDLKGGEWHVMEVFPDDIEQ
jgi:hypothetical protein